MRLPRMTTRRMMAAIALIASILGAAIYAVRPRSSTFSVVNRSGQPVSELLVIVTDFDSPPLVGPTGSVASESFMFRDLADRSTSDASFLSRGAGTWFRPPKRDTFRFSGSLSDGTPVKGHFGFLPEPGSQSRPSFVIDERGGLLLTPNYRPTGKQ